MTSNQQLGVTPQIQSIRAYRSRVIYNWLQYYSLDTLSAEFAVIGDTHSKLHGRTREAIVLPKQGTEVLEYEQKN